jgi:hypothetical protein
LSLFKFVVIEGWDWVKEATLTTIGKSSIKGKDISSEWKLKLLISEHSPGRELSIRWKVKNLERWIADQLVRHDKFSNPYMKTGRTDRGNIPRSEQVMTMATDLMKTENAHSLISMCESRLCIGTASKETRELIENLKKVISEKEPELGLVLVPSCIRRLSCKESVFGVKCKHLKDFLTWGKSIYPALDLTNMEDRLKAYENYLLWKEIK